MSDPEFLANAERALRELGQELVARLGTAEESTEVPGMSATVGRLSFIDAHQQHQMDLHAQRKMSSQLAAVHAALERIRNGSYGICMRCGTTIPEERLEYLLETPFCTACNTG